MSIFVASNHRYCRGGVLALLITAFAVPSVVWIVSDQRVWPFDPAYYGYWTLELMHARGQSVEIWLQTMSNSLRMMPPLLVWIGQFFVPLQRLTGDVESALLLVNVLFAAGTLTLIYLLARRLGAGLISSAAAVIGCAGAPLFLAFAYLYYAEMSQAFSVALAMFVAWRAEQRSLLRTFALSLLAVAVAFLAKATSGVFVLPMLSYIFVVLAITRGRPRPATTTLDHGTVVVALLVLAATLAWYWFNWASMAQHFANATTALSYGSAVDLPKKLRYWTYFLNLSLSPFTFISVGMAALVAVAVAMATFRSVKRPTSAWLKSIVDDGTLFGLALVGTVVASILAYSLQVNEDPRFLTPIVPFVAALIAWSLAVIRNRIVVGLAAAALAANAGIVHAYAFNLNPLRIVAHPWLYTLSRDRSDKILLTQAVHTMCRRETENRVVILAVNYASLNPNSAGFYAQQQREIGGHFCHYRGISFRLPNLAHVLEEVNAAEPLYIATIAPTKQLPADFANIFTRPFAEHMAQDSRFTLDPGSGDYLLIYRDKRLSP